MRSVWIGGGAMAGVALLHKLGVPSPMLTIAAIPFFAWVAWLVYQDIRPR